MTFASSSRKLTTETELYSLAIRALARRAHSIHQLREYLGRRTDDVELLSSVVARLRQSNYLDDARYALDYARQHAQSRRQGRFRIARELRGRGVPDRHIDDALAAVFADTDEAAVVRARVQRSLKHIRGALSARKLASLHRSLLRAGFSGEVIRAELKTVTRGELPELPDIDLGELGEA
jgi:regulatory protein